MPATSKQQWKFMKAVAEGNLKKEGLSKEEAKEYIKNQPSPKGLPKKAKRQVLERLARRKK